jgi:host factor-I protein
MAQQIREPRPAPPQANIQDVFLNYARREKLAVHIRLMDGTDFEGRVKNFDRFAVIVEHNGADHMVLGHRRARRVSPRGESVATDPSNVQPAAPH